MITLDTVNSYPDSLNTITSPLQYSNVYMEASLKYSTRFALFSNTTMRLVDRLLLQRGKTLSPQGFSQYLNQIS